MLGGYDDFLADTAKFFKCTKAFCLGDLFSWDTLSRHEKNPDIDFTATQEHKDADKQLKSIDSKLRKVGVTDFRTVIGNHDALPHRRAAEVGIPTSLLKSYRQIFGLKGWRIYKRFDGISYNGVWYHHGETGPGGQYAAHKQSKQMCQSVVAGHLHAELGAWFTFNKNMGFFGMNVGCGMDWKLLQFEYGQKFTRKPAISASVVLNVGRNQARPIPWQMFL